jgi:hypothetical protein
MNSIPLLRILAALGLIGTAALGTWHWQTLNAHKKELAEQADAHKRAVEDLEVGHRSALASEQEAHQVAIKAMMADHEKSLDGLRSDQRKQMATAFKEFENIFEGNRRTIDYIDALEGKVKAGQGVSKAEVEKLSLIATGISFLQKEYQKPFSEFKQLEDYLAKQAAALTTRDANAQPTRFGFFKRMFNKDFREAEKQQLRDQGAREAFEAAQTKFTAAYAVAQRQMNTISIDAEAYTKKLYTLIDEKQLANKEDLSSFFQQAREALRTHQEVLDFQPTVTPESTPRP